MQKGGKMAEKDWKDDLEDDLKEASELKDIPDVATLAKNYITTNKAYSARVDGIKEDEEWSDFEAKTSKFFKLPESESEYDVDVKENVEDIKKLGFKYKIHPKQVKHFSEDHVKILRQNDENTRKEELKNFEKEIEENFKGVKDKDELPSKGINNSGYKLDELKKELGHHFSNPKVQKMLYDYGKALSSDNKKGEEDKKTPETTGPQTTSKKTVEEKFEWMKAQGSNPKSPYMDSTHPKHAETVKKFKEFAVVVGKWADENEVELNLT